MNKAKLKSYAPAARRDFIQAVTDRAHFFGISEKEIVPVEESGDVAIIGGRPFPRAVAAQRRKLDARVKRDGFSQVMEAVAYTWFNRFLALRYMELHGYLEHGFRVISNTGSSTTPEILDHAAELDIPGLNKQRVTELKLDGNKDAELYRILLVAQCNALHGSMPFLFERIEDETELLLPDNLLHSDSLIRKLVTEIEEDDWKEVEIIGWLYQFYISEKKDEVIGKVVKSEDIPAATQLFTPNWIVKYMVQNSIGRHWLSTYPDSPLKAKMEYFIEPAEETEEVKKKLAEIALDSLDPENLTLIDPASGSGHILVEAYDVFKEIYLERGYSSRDYPRLILEKNLFGLDIDDRAAQMAGFALLMKARKDDRRILRSDNPVKLNVLAIQDSSSISIDNSLWGEQTNAIRNLVDLFQNGKTFGSLIGVPAALKAKLAEIVLTLKQALNADDLYLSQMSAELLPFVEQAILLAKKYDCVVANPPYIGGGYLNTLLKNLAAEKYNNSKSDLYSIFMQRCFELASPSGLISMMTPFTWLTIKSFEGIRKEICTNREIISLVQPEYHAFFESAYVPICTFVVRNTCTKSSGVFVDLSPYYGADIQGEKLLEVIACPKHTQRFEKQTSEFVRLPGMAILFSISREALSVFISSEKLGEIADISEGIKTGDNQRFLRFWQEVPWDKVSLTKAQDKKWVPHHKGGEYRRWYGNLEHVINWENDGAEIKTFPGSGLQGRSNYFNEGITWSKLSSSYFGVRLLPSGVLFDSGSPAVFPYDKKLTKAVLSYLSSNVASHLVKKLNPTLNFQVGNVAALPFPASSILSRLPEIEMLADELISAAKASWDESELSWNFQKHPLLEHKDDNTLLSIAFDIRLNRQINLIEKIRKLEVQNNSIFIDMLQFKYELSPDVSESQVTITLTSREADIKRLTSYAIGCMMGRYCLDNPGLIYANSGNESFTASKYVTFPADDDGIVPVMDMDWFPDDAASRIEEFLKVTWPPETLEENLKFVADSLLPKGGETPRETIRRYISTQFYKDHLQIYKKRPVYWLFSSGKQRAFECLVYLHRYNESTLSRMRNEYVTPLLGKFSAQADYLSNEVNAASSTAERNRLQKQLDTLRKKQVELASFDDLLRHYADQRISLNLDDGVKVNYGKFGNLLAEVKAITGGNE